MINKDCLSALFAEYEGKKVYNCKMHIGQRINYDFNGISFCHEMAIGNKPAEVSRISSFEAFSVENYYVKMKELIGLFQNPDYPCRKCPMCIQEEFHFQPITWVTINTSAYCNSSCVYCMSHFGKKGDGYDPTQSIMEFQELGLFDKDCLFDWGGGEPTQNPFFEKTVSMLVDLGYHQRINTNGIEFSNATYNALKQGKANLRMSLDSGSKECFIRVKGHEKYEEVWGNLEKYASVSDDIDIKYNIFNQNSELEEIDLFLEKCKKIGIKNIHIDGEVSSYQPVINAGPFYFTKKEFDAAHYMEEKAISMGFAVTISPYAFRARAEYKNGKLALPSVFYDNLDHETLKNQIYLTRVASVTNLLDIVKKYKKIAVILTDSNAEIMVNKLLKDQSIDFDTYASITEAVQKNDKVGDSAIWLVGDHWKTELSNINNSLKSCELLLWFPERYLSDYYEDNIVKYPIPEELIPKGSRVAVYGYGVVGKRYAEQLKSMKEYTFIYSIDKNADYYNGEEAIIAPEKISNDDFDYVVIALKNQVEGKKVIEQLCTYGIEKRKVIYDVKPYRIINI